LQQPGLDIGDVESCHAQIIALPPESRAEATLQLVQARPELYQALRQCCFCGHCTASCATRMTAPARMREWREPLMLSGLMPVDDSKLVMVDNEWHIFSAYRAIYGIAYPEFLQLPDLADDTGARDAASNVDANAADGTAAGAGAVGAAGAADGSAGVTVDTLFFPGCSLVSYAPELVRRIGQWLDDAGCHWALSDDCCGSPLMSAGLFERSVALRERLLGQIRATGIIRVLTVCPGCGEELAEVFGDEVDIVPLPELICEHISAGGKMPGGSGGSEIPGSGGGGGGNSNNSGGGGDNGDGSNNGACGKPDDDKPGCPGTAPDSLTFFDSCHDRFDTRHGTAVRKLLKLCFPQTPQLESEHHGKQTLCCGAGGAVSPFDPEISARRAWRVIDEARATGASTLITTCPTCTYTIAQTLLGATAGQAPGLLSRNYLELVFGQAIDWAAVFSQLETMWSGEYGPWLNETFF
jgi:hypothetical protein